MSRTHNKHVRVYVDGVDLSGYSRQVGTLGWTFGAEPDMSFTDEVKNIIPGQAEIMAGPINAFVDNDTAGLFALAGIGSNDHGSRNVTIAIGANAAPVAGNPIFTWKFEQAAYAVEQGSGFVGVNVPLPAPSSQGILSYCRPWGFLLHAKGIETAVNTATGLDDNGGSSALGGIFIYHLLSSDGTVTLKAQDAAVNADGSFADLTGATSGSIDASVTPKSGLVALSVSATIRRYTRWQLAFGTATTCTFVLGLIRNNLIR